MDNESVVSSKSGLFDFVFMQPLLEGPPLRAEFSSSQSLSTAN